MKASANLGDLIPSIYDAVSQADVWPQVLTDIGLYVGGAWLVLGFVKLSGGAELNVQDRAGDPGHLALFNAKFTTPDVNPAVLRLVTASPGTVVLREQEMTDGEWLASPLYREIYKPRGLYHGMGALVLKTSRHIAPIGINRPRRDGPFTARDLARLNDIIPHLRRALTLADRLGSFQGLSETHELLWDRASYGVILLNREGTVIGQTARRAPFWMQATGLRSARAGYPLCARTMTRP